MDTEPYIAEAKTRPAAVNKRIGYLLSRYPAISHTFFLHEVIGLRARGVELETASINRLDRPLAELP
jgi:colanic acid/amylovoran biosynthesis glycosyltransferase